MSDNQFEEYRRELNELNLKTREDLENLTKPLIKEATKIILKKSSKEPKDSHLKSQFGGQPYFEKGEKWPKTKGGDNLEFVFQIFNENNIALPKNIKLIQFYYDFNRDELSIGTDDDGWHVKIYENLHKENIEIIKKPSKHNTVKYCEIEYEVIQSLPDWEGIDACCENASKLSCVLNEDEPWENYDKIVEELVGEQDIWSQLGSYPHWIQGFENENNYTFLFQIDSEENAGLMWGDCGLIYVFYDTENKKLEFLLQCY